MIFVSACVIFTACAISSYPICDFPSAIKTPEDLSAWLNSDFRYIIKIPDYNQSPAETVTNRSGDCDDFAYLSQAVLSSIGVSNTVVIIRFRQLGIMHAICLFKQGDRYSFLSNRSIVRTRASTINDAISQSFPDWEQITLMDGYGGNRRVVDRGCAVNSGSSATSGPLACGDLPGSRSLQNNSLPRG